ncbi:MAG TPA: hypothetical protein VMR97_10830 [Acidimicrobiales bacterium]|nr:hypothetical protein [Acidimicrobiales bacterium]
MRNGTSTLRRLACAALLSTGATAAAAIAFAPAAHADDSSNATQISGYTATVQALGVQYAFDIPGMFPLPNQNLLEEDVPFARTLVQQGPVVNAIGTPYYPGDILGHFGSLLSEFAPSQLTSAPTIGNLLLTNDPLLAEAEYPAVPGHGQDASFGGTPPAGVPIAPNVASGTAHADENGASVTATISDLQTSPPSSTNSSLAHLGPAASSNGSLLSDSSGPMLDIGSIQSTNGVNIGQAQITGTATDVLKTIDVAGVLDISQITSSAGASSDGNTGSPTSSFHLAGVTVDSQPAYIDNQGVHVSGTSTSSTGVTPQQAQNSLNATFAQDGISVRLLDPATNTNGAEGTSNAGGLVISFVHQFNVPYVQGEPTVPVCVQVPPSPTCGSGKNDYGGLGNQALPAGTYTATTSITLGSATSDVQATQVPASSPSSALSSLPGGDLQLGLSTLGSSFPAGSSTTFGAPGTNGSPGTATSPQSLGARTSDRLPFGIPAPVGWLVVALVLCVITAYPMLLAARWQFLSGRGR